MTPRPRYLVLGLVAALLLSGLGLALHFTKANAAGEQAARAIVERFGLVPPQGVEDPRFVQRSMLGARADARFDLAAESALAPLATALCPGQEPTAGLPSADAFDPPASWRLIADTPGARGVACRDPVGGVRALLAAPVDTPGGLRLRVYLHGR